MPDENMSHETDPNRFNIGPTQEHFNKFNVGAQVDGPTSQANTPDVMMQQDPVPGQPEQDPGRDQGERGAYELAAGHMRSPDLREFAERFSESEVREQGHRLLYFWIDRYVNWGEPPNNYIFADIILRAGSRVQMLRHLMERPEYPFSQDEVSAGLKPGPIRTPVPLEYKINPNINISQENGNLVWVKKVNGGEVKLGRFDSDLRWVDKLDAINVLIDNDPSLQERFGTGRFNTNRQRVDAYVVHDVTDKEARGKRKEIADAVETEVNLFEAWNNFFGKVVEQDMFASDLESYVDKMFTRIGKAVARSHSYGEIFNAPESVKGLKSFGEKTVVAYKAWKEIAEGRAMATFHFKNSEAEGDIRSEEMVVPNRYAMKRNRKLRELGEKYVAARIAQELPPAEGLTDELILHDTEENLYAAKAGDLVMDHWDEDARAAMDILRTDRGLPEVVMEGAIADKFKLLYATVRRYSEAYGFTPLEEPHLNKEEKRRKNPREAGAWATLKVLPLGTGSFPEVATVEAAARNVGTGKMKVIRVTVDQLAFGALDKNGNRILIQRDDSEEQHTRVRQAEDSSNVTDRDYWEFKLRGLDDREMWDSIQVVKQVGDEIILVPISDIKRIVPNPPQTVTSAEKVELQKKKMKLAQGTQTNEEEVPVSLYEFYGNTIFNEFNRTDIYKQYQDYTKSENDYIALKKLNKRFQVGTKALVAQAQLSKDTVEKLEQFQRIALVAGVAASIARYKPADKEKVPAGLKQEQQPTISNVIAEEPKEVTIALKRAIFNSRFVRTKTIVPIDMDITKTWADPLDEELFEFIINNRDKGPMSPWEINNEMKNAKIKPYFKDSQLDELRPLYQFLPEAQY
jgi:hypothetical protein